MTLGPAPGPGEFYCVTAELAMPIISANVAEFDSYDLAIGFERFLRLDSTDQIR